MLRAAQFHEFVTQLVERGTQGEVSYVPRMRTQLVAASAVAEVLADLATEPGPGGTRPAAPPARPARPRTGLPDIHTQLTCNPRGAWRLAADDGARQHHRRNRKD